MKTIVTTNSKGIQTFEHEVFGKIRTLTDEKGKTFFAGKDVAQALGYEQADKAILRHVDKDDRTKHTVIDSKGRAQQAYVLNESGLYALILSSKMEQARQFKHWVTSEVLPQIRQTGGYIPTRNARTGEELTEGDIIQRANGIMQRTIARRNLPADDCLTTTDIARGLGMDVKELNHLLVDKGIIRWTGGRFRMTPQYAELGYDESRLFCYRSKEGEAKERTYLVWTPRGKTFIEGIVDRLTD